MAETAAAISSEVATRPRPAPGQLVPGLVPWIGLGASIVSTAALAIVLGRAVAVPRPSLPRPPVAAAGRYARIIPPGHEAEILRLVVHGAGDDVPPSERPPVAGIEAAGGDIVVTFGGYPESRLTIRSADADSEGAAFLRTDAIAASWSGDRPPEPIRRYVSSIARAPGWRALWTAVSDDDQADSHPLTGASGSKDVQMRPGLLHVGTWAIVLLALVAGNVVVALLLVAAGRQRSKITGTSFRAAPERRRDAGLSPLAVSVAVMALGVALFAAAHFHFRMDDYPFLAIATYSPSAILGETRILTTRVHYQVGVLLGAGSWWFASSNLAFLGATCVWWGLLLRRLGFPRDAALLAASLQGLGPGTFFLLRQANGIEHLSATACLMLVLLLTDLAARETDQSQVWRYAVLVLALCLSLLGVVMKLPLMVVLPPSCWLWGRWLVRHPAPPMHRSVTYLAFAGVVGGAMLMLSPENGPLGFLPSRMALEAIRDRLWAYAVATGVFLALGALWAIRRDPITGGAAANPAAGVIAVLRSRVGRLPLLAWSVITSALWFTPFVLHAGYEGQAHYGMLASAPLNAVGALLIASAARGWAPRGWRRFAAAATACAILLPAADIRRELRESATDFVPAWLDGVPALTAARARPQRIVVAPACARSAVDPPLSDDMVAIHWESGIWFATGWYGVPVEFRDSDAPTEPRGDTAMVATLGYCRGIPPTLE